MILSVFTQKHVNLLELRLLIYRRFGMCRSPRTQKLMVAFGIAGQKPPPQRLAPMRPIVMHTVYAILVMFRHKALVLLSLG